MKRKILHFLILFCAFLTSCQTQNFYPTDLSIESPSDDMSSYPTGMAENYSYMGPQANNPIPYPGNDDSSQTPNLQIPTDALTPDEGYGSLIGVLYSFTIQQTIPSTNFYLTKGWGAEEKDLPPIFYGPDASKGDVVGISDEDGIIRLNNIPPGNYFLVIEAPASWSLAVVSDKDFSPLLISIESNEQKKLDVIYTSWP